MSLLTPEEKLVAIYNASLIENSQDPVDIDDFDISVPQVYSGARSAKTTVVQLTPKAGAPSVGIAKIYYDRIDLTNVTTLTVDRGGANSLAELLPALNEELGLEFSTDDFQPTSFGGGDPNFTLTAKASNLIMTGSATVTFE